MRTPEKRAAKQERRRLAREARIAAMTERLQRYGSTIPEVVSEMGARLRAVGDYRYADALDRIALQAGVVPADIAAARRLLGRDVSAAAVLESIGDRS